MAHQEDTGAGSERPEDKITLREVVGAILKDVAESRFTSDLYSRDISRYYEQDDILKVFPVPRSEIKELEMEFRFAFSEAKREDTRIEIRRRRAIHNFVIFSNVIASNMISSIVNTMEKNDPSILKEDDWKKVKDRLQSRHFQMELEKILYDYFNWGIDIWIGISPKGKLDIEKLWEDLSNFLMQGSRAKTERINEREKNYEPVFSQRLFGNYFNIFASNVFPVIKDSLINQLQEMKFRFNFINEEQDKEVNVYVDVTANKLQNIELGKLSVIKVKTVLKSYIWTELDDHGKSRLIAE